MADSRVVGRGEQGCAMNAGKVLCAQSSLGKVYADCPTPKTARSRYNP